MRCIYLATKLSVIILNEDKDFITPENSRKQEL